MKKDFEQHMTSIEIAEITHQNHKEVMKAIKKLEPEWVKQHGSGFELVMFRDEKEKYHSCYSLTKTQSLFVASHLAKESLSIFIIRWEQLYREMQEFVIPNMNSDEEILDQADDIIADKLAELNRTSKYCHRTCEIARLHDMSSSDLLSFLADRKIVHKVNFHYELTRHYRNKGLEEYFYGYRNNIKGKRVLKKTIVWTDEGKRFINEILYELESKRKSKNEKPTWNRD